MFNELNDEEFCREVYKILEKNLRKDQNIQEPLIEYFGKSYSSIKQRYKICTRKTIYSTHEGIRLYYTIENLKVNKCIVAMKELGFEYESNFARWFKRHKGMNPSEYKNLNL